MTQFSNLPDYIRISDIIGNVNQGKPAILPIGYSTWWKYVKLGYVPQPIYLSPRVPLWKKEDIEGLLLSGGIKSGGVSQ